MCEYVIVFLHCAKAVEQTQESGGFLEMNDRDSSQDLGVWTLEVELGKNPEVFGRRKKG